MGFNAFIEGWAPHAEQFADEFGLHADDARGRLVDLQAQRFRAAQRWAQTPAGGFTTR